MYEVFKAVTPTEDPDVFLSYYDNNVARLTYSVGETMESKTPIFVFPTRDIALKYHSRVFPKAVFKAETSQPPQLLPVSRVLFLEYLDTAAMQRAFWHDMFHLSAAYFARKYGKFCASAPAHTLIVYDLKLVERIA